MLQRKTLIKQYLFFFKATIIWDGCFQGKHQQCFVFFFKSCVEGNRILICMTGQPKSGQPWHPPVPQWHEEEWLPTIFQLCSQFPLPSLLELPLIFSYQFRLPKYHFVSQHPTVFKQGFHRFLLIKHSLVEDKQLGYLNSYHYNNVTNIKVKMVKPNSIKLQRVPFQ